MENSGKSLAIPCTSRGTLEKLYPVGIQVFIDAAASPVTSRSVHGAPGPSLKLVPPGFPHQQWREHLRKPLREVHKVGKFLMLIKNLLRFKCLLFLSSKNLSFQPPPSQILDGILSHLSKAICTADLGRLFPPQITYLGPHLSQ